MCAIQERDLSRVVAVIQEGEALKRPAAPLDEIPGQARLYAELPGDH